MNNHINNLLGICQLGKPAQESQIPRSGRAVETEVYEILYSLNLSWRELVKDEATNEFIEQIFKDMLEGGADGDEWKQDILNQHDDNTPINFPLISCAYCAQALTAPLETAWSYVADARYWEGITRASFGEIYGAAAARSAIATNAANVKNAPEVDSRELVIDYYLKHISEFKDKGNAATVIFELHPRLVSSEWQTIRNYLKGQPDPPK